MTGWELLWWAPWRCEDSNDVDIGSKSRLVESSNLAALGLAAACGVRGSRVVAVRWRAKLFLRD